MCGVNCRNNLILNRLFYIMYVSITKMKLWGTTKGPNAFIYFWQKKSIFILYLDIKLKIMPESFCDFSA